MAITTTLVGSLGGTSIQSQSVTWDTNNMSVGLNTVATLGLSGSGKWNYVLTGTEENLSTTVSVSSWPFVVINGADVGRVTSRSNSSDGTGRFGVSGTLTGVSSIQVAVNKYSTTTTYRSVFSGTLFWWPAT